ncbi:kinase-associated lipoprotein B [Macrococcus armenti]|uniref:kinase-associated lipoprotein B n=1 Tax=Macrococcus armenti TaxID=2875764 RepID=UPI001CC998AB|nr:kinase-associated lipoprotein B [Macrococcus armenti]UBH09255.1 kinase-associated lipoprotein B [Macrococcus armenti]UBH11551.1 kinase-associated lipoprotein B [Macrococcus armenti]UBH16017.1 kinase-associated lipoprotein B [Macrococcus armenti]UBH18378.1 kinase-associated lipoprotein B [Macrococcus armenti]UBH20644.1 kinase-associated lipoprotein B [Macrococcus armenti]
MYFRLMHKTGIYIVEHLESRQNGELVQVINVITHPTQGDLHNRNEVENVFFHERRALSYKEKRIVDKNLLKPYEDDVLSYEDSLRNAINKMEEKLKSNDNAFNKQSLLMLQNLKAEYAKQYKTDF